MSSKNVARRHARIIAIKSLFMYIQRDEKIKHKNCIDCIEIEEKTKNPFGRELFAATVKEIKKLRIILKTLAPEFPYEKIVPINRVILLTGISEMKNFDTPPLVVINEYIEIAKEYAEEKSGPFVNGVLDKYKVILKK